MDIIRTEWKLEDAGKVLSREYYTYVVEVETRDGHTRRRESPHRTTAERAASNAKRALRKLVREIESRSY